MRVDLIKTIPVSRSVRAKQLEAMFDVPQATESTQHWQGDCPVEERAWHVGVIVGPSGSGKSSVLREYFGAMPALSWGAAGVIDDFASTLSMEAISSVCQAVGFNTIPAWMRPYAVLSTGEQFRVDLARRLVEQPAPVVVDEFTSVVDRQVAKIGAHAVQKYVRRQQTQFVAATCHYDVLDWLQPDWVLEMPLCRFTWRALQRRPTFDCTLSPVPYAAWSLFAPFHYLTAELHRAARCFCLFVEGRPAAFAGLLHRPHPKVRDIMGCSRLVTLPDWQGMGFALALIDELGAAYTALGKRLHTYPAHPALIRSFTQSPRWTMTQKAGSFGAAAAASSSLRNPAVRGGAIRHHVATATLVHRPPHPTSALTGPAQQQKTAWRVGSRPCAVFAYCGAAMDVAAAQRVLRAHDET